MPSEELPMFSRAGRWSAGERPNRRRGASWGLLPTLLIYVFFMNLSPTLAINSTVVDKTKMSLVRNMTETTMSTCIKPLEASPTIVLRMEVKPLGPGSNKVHIAGGVDIHDDLEVGLWSRLHYEYTSVNKELYLRVSLNRGLNSTELPYKPFRDMYSGRYKLHVVKMYMKGRMEMFDGDECPVPPFTTEPPAPTTTVMSPSTSPLSRAKLIIRDEPSEFATEPPADNTQQNPAPITKAGTNSWIWTMGAVGSIPALVIVMAVVVLLVVVTIPAVSSYCAAGNSRKREGPSNTSSKKKNYDPFGGCTDPLMQQAHSTNREDSTNPQVAQFSIRDTSYNPVYKPPSSSVNGAPPPNFYSN